MQRAELAASFVQHPYWQIMAKSMSGTIQRETEQALASDEHIAINRASVAMCRKYLNMPFIDIEQGKLAMNEYEKAMARGRNNTLSGQPREVQ